MSAFAIYPAIDLLDGRAVRLTKGKRETAEVVPLEGGDPQKLARLFHRAAMLHIVDLDGAFRGKVAQTALIAKLARLHPVQAGGGVRTLKDVQDLLDAGASRVVIGTAALENPPLLAEALARHGPEKIVVAVDVKDGFVAASGWTTTSSSRPRELAHALAQGGVKHVLCTAVHKDGTLEGPDLAVLDDVNVSNLSIIASGGIGSLDDVKSVKKFGGVVIGKALYAQRFTLDEALAC
jgi:phosphoribosylformimino-5-aminoimidazole carboxamide ribotide isomerase